MQNSKVPEQTGISRPDNMLGRYQSGSEPSKSELKTMFVYSIFPGMSYLGKEREVSVLVYSANLLSAVVASCVAGSERAKAVVDM